MELRTQAKKCCQTSVLSCEDKWNLVLGSLGNHFTEHVPDYLPSRDGFQVNLKKRHSVQLEYVSYGMQGNKTTLFLPTDQFAKASRQRS